LNEYDRKGKGKICGNTQPDSCLSDHVSSVQWRKPSAGWVKVNTDASFFPDNGSSHWGAIVRNRIEDVVLNAWSPIDRCQSAEEAEAIAALQGIQLAAKLTAQLSWNVIAKTLSTPSTTKRGEDHKQAWCMLKPLLQLKRFRISRL
jgi:hypothetical protein